MIATIQNGDFEAIVAPNPHNGHGRSINEDDEGLSDAMIPCDNNQDDDNDDTFSYLDKGDGAFDEHIEPEENGSMMMKAELNTVGLVEWASLETADCDDNDVSIKVEIEGEG